MKAGEICINTSNSSQLFSAGLDAIEIMTEEYPPYNFTEKGKVVGIAADFLNEIFAVSGEKINAKGMQVLPWANGYAQAQAAGKTNMLFSTTRTYQCRGSL